MEMDFLTSKNQTENFWFFNGNETSKMKRKREKSRGMKNCPEISGGKTLCQNLLCR